jgi:hypothetical protein
MATEIKTWQIIDGKLEVLDSSMIEEGKKESYDLESWIASNPSIIGPELVVIGRQVSTKSGPIDLLAIDRTGNIVIVELKRDILPREALAQAIDYASDAADWNIERIGEICAKYTGKSLDDLLNESFPDLNLENININETQRIILVGFSIDSALERMINWLSDHYNVNINAVLLKYTKTRSGDELLTKTSIISEEVEQERVRKRKFQIPMSDEPGDYDESELRKQLVRYFLQNLWSARRIRRVLLPVCLEQERVTRDQLKDEFVKCGEADSVRDAGYFLSLISQQVGMEKNAFLRQVIGYDYPKNPWEKDNYRIRDGYADLVREVLSDLADQDDRP